MAVDQFAVDAALAAPPATTAKRSHVFAILVLALAMVSAAALRGVFAPVQDVAKASMHLSDVQMGWIQGIAASIPIAALAMPIGRLVDRTRRFTLLILMSLIWSAGAIWTAYANDFLMLFLARMLAGLGSITSLVVAISLVSDMASQAMRGRVMILLSVGVNVGTAIAFAAGGLLLSALPKLTAGGVLGLEPWRAVNLLFGVAGVLITLLMLPQREPARQEIENDVAAFGPAMRALWQRRGFLIPLFVGQVSVVMADAAAAVWAAPVAGRVYLLTPAQFGPLIGGVVLLTGILGAVVGGLAADLGHKLKLRGGIMVGAVIMSLVSIPAAAFPIMPDVTGFAVTLGVLLLCGAAVGLVTATALTVLIPNEIRGVCLGAFVVVASIIGFGVAPVLVAKGSLLLGGESHLAQALAVTGVIVDVLSAIGFIAAFLDLRKTKPA